MSKRGSLLPGALWAIACLLMGLAALIAVPTLLFSWPTALGVSAFVLLALSALALLATMLVTLPRPGGYEWRADFGDCPPMVGWPLRIGSWIGKIAVGIVHVWISLTTPGGGVAGPNVRLTLSVLAGIGALVAAFTAQAVPVAAFLAQMALWGAVITIAILRGLYGFITWTVRTLKGDGPAN